MKSAVPDTMRCAVLTAPRTIEIVRRPVPQPGPDDVLIKVAQVGVCGGDLHYFRGGSRAESDEPRIIGHEATGTVVTDGRGFRRGQKVVVDPLKWDGTCEFCKRGDYYMCLQRDALARSGGWRAGCAEYIAVPYDHCYVVPDSVSWEEAVCIHPLSSIVHCSDRVPHQINETALVIGLGPAGFFHLQVEKKCHRPRKVIAAGRSPFRMQLARELGADVVIDTTEEDLVSRVLVETDGLGADFVVDATGNPKIQEQLTALTKKRGHIAVYSPGTAMFPLGDVVHKELTLIGSSGVSMLSAVDLVATRTVEVKKLVTHHFELADTQRAFELAVSDSKGDFVKATITVA